MKDDVSIMLPVEHLDSLLEVINVGLQRAKIDPAKRRELMAWWSIEKEYIEEELHKEE